MVTLKDELSMTFWNWQNIAESPHTENLRWSFHNLPKEFNEALRAWIFWTESSSEAEYTLGKKHVNELVLTACHIV